MGDKDVDEQFADIVAHWHDDAPPTADDDTGRPSPPVGGTTANPPLEPSPNPTNPPPTRPFVVWRGAGLAADDEQVRADADGRGDDPHDGGDDDYRDPVVLTHGYRAGLLVCAVLLVAGGIVSWVGLRRLPAHVEDQVTEGLGGTNRPSD